MNSFNSESKKSDFLPWYTDPIWVFVRGFFRKRLILIGIITFLGYWGIPLILSFFQHTLYPSQMTNAWGNEPLAYLNDSTHLTFAITISLAGILCIYTLFKIPQSISLLAKQMVLNAPIENVMILYYKNRKFANSNALKILSFAFSLFAGIAFFSFYYSPQYVFWWGNISHGYANFYFVLVEIVMVYYGTQFFFLLILYSRFLISVLRLGITPKIFHHDGSNGLGSLGEIIMLMWVVAIFVIACIFIVIFYGYMGLEDNFLIQLIIGVASLTIPIIAILPLFRSLNEISKVRKMKLQVFGNILNDCLIKIEEQAIDDNMEEVKTKVNSFLEVQQIYTSISKMNVFPFNPRALAFVIVVYSFQIGITVYQLFKV